MFPIHAVATDQLGNLYVASTVTTSDVWSTDNLYLIVPCSSGDGKKEVRRLTITRGRYSDKRGVNPHADRRMRRLDGSL